MAANKNEYALHKDESWETALVKDRTCTIFHYYFFKNYKIALKLKCKKKKKFSKFGSFYSASMSYDVTLAGLEQQRVVINA